MPNQNKVVKYHNDMNSVALPGFSPTDLNIFSASLYAAKGKGTKEHIIFIDELMDLAGYAGKDKKRFMNYLDKLTDRMLDLKYKKRDADGGFDKFGLYMRFKTVTDPATGREALLQKISSEFAYVLNTDPEYLPNGVRGLLSGGYTKYELDQHNDLVSTYSKNAFRHLKRFERTGWWRVDVDEFRRLLDVPEKYRLSDLRRRVLGPIREELPKYFKNLKIEEITGKGPGGRKTTIQLYFTFDKNLEKGVWYNSDTKAILEDAYACPVCGNSLYLIIKENGDIFYGHEDGWKASAPCRQTFGSLDEILGMNSTLSENESRVESDGKVSDAKKAGFSCRECGRPLYILHNKDNEEFYGHIDGWKKDAPCKKTYSSIADLMGYSETPTRQDHYDLYNKDDVGSDIPEGAAGVYETISNVIGNIKEPKD